MKLLILFIFIFSSLQQSKADSGHSDQHNPLKHAPIGIMGDHTHNQGEIMFSYRYMDMSMNGLRQGNRDVSNELILNQFMIAPISMDMNMHMFGLMYAPNDRITLMGMLNYQENEMLMLNRMGHYFRTTSTGLADSKLNALIRLNASGNNHLHAQIGVSLPTGSINPRDMTPMADNMLLPYPMRLSSGTYDVNLGLTWNRYRTNYALGAQIMSIFRTGENEQNYRLGHETKVNFWSAWMLSPSWSFSSRIEAMNQLPTKGSDPRITMLNMSPTASAHNSGGNFVSLAIGINYVSNANNWTNGHRLAIEFNTPVIQDFDGIQMKTNNSLTIGWQKAF